MKYRFDVPARTGTLFFIAFAISLSLSMWMGYRESVINSDAICYVLSAQSIGVEGLRYAAHVCNQSNWPLYSSLIYVFAQITHFTYPAAAYLLNSIFSLLSVGAFILIVKELGGSQRVLWLAAFTILLSHQFNSVREYIIRDHGYWAFYLASMLFLLKYARRPRLKFALAFNISLILATLFRMEGIVFLVLLPFVTWFQNRYSLRQRARNFTLLYAPIMLAGIGFAIWSISHLTASGEVLHRLMFDINDMKSGFYAMGDRFHAAKLELRHSILTRDAAGQAGIVIISAWLAWYALSIIGNLSWIYSYLCLYAMRSRTIILRSTAPIILYWYIGINILITASFLGVHLFLSKRYLIALTLVFMLWVPFALNDLLRKWPSARHRMILGVAILFIFASAIGGIFDFGYSKQYVRDAGTWISREVPRSAELYSNDIQLMYYTNHFGDDIFKKSYDYAQLDTIDHGKWKQYDYLALRIDRKDRELTSALLKRIDGTVVNTFKNKRGDHVVIYKIARGGATQ